ncbi:MAG: glycosyltransferase, partial [Bacteroides sp.]|nr:glycosyltransferase [Bacteroides sp.]
MHNRPTPKFSVITVTYNAEAVLEDTIQSVISQTYRHVEYIIVDGASKDRTLAIAERYRDHITRIVSEPDKGLYDAMNKGIGLATGDYLCFLNAGDSFHEDDTLQQMVHTLSGNELPDVMYGETALVYKEGHFRRMRRLSTPEALTWKSFKQGML